MTSSDLPAFIAFAASLGDSVRRPSLTPEARAPPKTDPPRIPVDAPWPTTFGELDSYWDYYDKISDKFDHDLIHEVSTSLDILLIFVSFPVIPHPMLMLTLLLGWPLRDHQHRRPRACCTGTESRARRAHCATT